MILPGDILIVAGTSEQMGKLQLTTKENPMTSPPELVEQNHSQ